MARQPRRFRARNLSVNIASGPVAQLADKLRICILHTNVCLGWTQCRLFTHYCLGWISWCRLFTCRGGTIFCDRPYSWIACRVGTQPDPGCGPGSIYVDPGDILTDPQIYAQQVAELKADLQAAIRELDAHEKEVEEAIKEAGPQQRG